MTEKISKESDSKVVRSARDPYFDNLKGILMLLVVFGHLIEPWIASNDSLKGVYAFLYTFHMPLFVFVAGVFSRRYVGNSAKFRKTLIRVATLYLLFDLVYKIADAFFFSGHEFSLDPLRPYWIMWFLLSLSCWHLVSPLILRSKSSIPIAFLIGIGGGYVTQIGYFFSLSRTLYFLPFFVIGCHLGMDGVKQAVSGWGRKIVALLALALAVRFSVFLAPEINVSWLYGSRGFDAFGLVGTLGGVFRALTYALALGISASVMVLVPRGRIWLSSIGESTLAIYLLHGFLVRSLIALGYYVNFQSFQLWILVGVELAFVYLIVSPFSKKIVKKLAEVIRV